MIESVPKFSEEISETKDIAKTNTECRNNTTQKSSNNISSKTSEKEKEKEKEEKKSVGLIKIIKGPTLVIQNFFHNNILIFKNFELFKEILFFHIYRFLYEITLNNHEYNHLVVRKNNIIYAHNYSFFKSNNNKLIISKKKEENIMEYLLYYIIFILRKFFICFSLMIKYNNEKPLIIYNIMKYILDIYFPLNSLIPNYFNTFTYKVGFIADKYNNKYFIIQIIIYFQEDISRNVLNGNKIYKLIEGKRKTIYYSFNDDNCELIDEYKNKIIIENTKDNKFYEDYNNFYDNYKY